MSMRQLFQTDLRRGLKVVTVFVLCALLLSVIAFYTNTVFYKKAVIGVVRIYGYLIYDQDKELYLRMIDYAIQNKTIDAVIVRINSPGGYAVYVETIYSGLRLLASKKPVIAVIEGIGASGGYFVALAADRIFAEPSSFVGGIGVIAVAPKRVSLPSNSLETGPYKYTGFPLLNFSLVLRRALNNFVSVIKERRGSKLKISINDLCKGNLFIGTKAKELGLVDEVGTFWDAIKYVMKILNRNNYELVSLKDLILKGSGLIHGSEIWKKCKCIDLNQANVSSPYILQIYYLYPAYINMSNLSFSYVQFTSIPTTVDLGLKNAIVIDFSHNNAFSIDELEVFISKAIQHGIKIRFLTSSYRLPEAFSEKPLAYIIINPRKSFTVSEIRELVDYVKNGGKLILIYDPTRTSPESINLIAEEFGLYFSNGFLFNMYKNYGVYRNIILTKFGNCTLTSNISELVMFTATCILCNESYGIVFTSNNTCLSYTEQKGVYIVVAKKDNVIAIGDFTFLVSPYCFVADNMRFIDNLLKFIKG